MTSVTARGLPASSPPPATGESVDLDAKWYLVGGAPVQGGGGEVRHGSQIGEEGTLTRNCKALLDREVCGSLRLLATGVAG